MFTKENTSNADLLFGFGLFCMNEGATEFSVLLPHLHDGTRAATSKDFVVVRSDGVISLAADLGYTRVGFDNRFAVPGDWQIVGQISDIVTNAVGRGVPSTVNLCKNPYGVEDNDPDAEEFKRSRALAVLNEIDAQRNKKRLTPARFVALYHDVVKNVAPDTFASVKEERPCMCFSSLHNTKEGTALFRVDTRPFFENAEKYPQTVEAFAEFLFYHCEDVALDN